MSEFEETIGELTQSLNGQYPRPWMTKMEDPFAADVFIVGRNHRNGYSDTSLGPHKRHLDALFNRNGESCRAMYDEMTAGKSYPTRKNTDRFVRILERFGIERVLETNVICYSSPMSADLIQGRHTGGAKRGEEIFRYLLESIKPWGIIVHGTGSKNQLSRILKVDLGPEPTSVDDIRTHKIAGTNVFDIPSIAPPAFNKWAGWADDHLELMARELAKLRKTNWGAQ